jgi:hypothetical protein
LEVVKWVRDNWDDNPDISPMMPSLAAKLDELRLQDLFDDEDDLGEDDIDL